MLRVEAQGQGLLVELVYVLGQHEVDHLDGILFVTKISEADRMKARKVLREMEERAAEAGTTS